MKRLPRRAVLKAGIGAIAGAVSLLLGGGLVAFFVDPWRHKPREQWMRLCRLDELDSIEPTHLRVSLQLPHLDGTYEQVLGVFAILTAQGPLVFSNACTHMHCAVRWLSWRQQITCPCHGGFYDRWGNLIGGPPPRSLPLLASEVRGDEVWVSNRKIERSGV